jgi:capsular polysaccharide biosynthesis protein
MQMQQFTFKTCEELLSKVSSLYDQGNFSLVYALCVDGLKHCPDMFQLSYFAGLAAHRMGNKDDCVNLLHDAYRACKDGSNKNKIQRLLCLHIIDAVSPHSTELVTKILNNDNNDGLVVPKYFLDGVQFAITFINNALSHTLHIFQSPKELGEVYYEMGKLYYLSSRSRLFSQQEKDNFLKNALAACEAAVYHQPTNLFYLKYLADIKSITKDFNGAIVTLLELLSNDRSAAFDRFLINFSIGKLYLKRSEHHKALEHFKEALQYKTQATPIDGDFYVSMGRTFCDLNLLDEALDIYYRILSEGIEVDENEGYGSLHIELARIAFKKKEYDRISVFSTKAVNAKGESIGVYRILSVKEWCENNGLKYHLLLENQKLEIPKLILASEDDDSGEQYYGTVEIPEVYVAEVFNVKIIAGHQPIILDNSHTAFDDALHLSEARCLWENEVVLGLENKMLLLCSPKEHEYIDEGIALYGAASNNYFHWLIEHLGRFWGIEQLSPAYDDLPLLVDEGLHDNFIKMLSMVAPDRKIIYLKREATYSVGKLVVPSKLSLMPMNLKMGESISWDDGVFSPVLISYLREKFGVEERVKANKNNRKALYISRKNISGRKLLNEEEIETFLVNCGFEVIEPQYMSFAEQLEVFSQAKIIVAPTGAAVTNLIFAPSNITVVIFYTEKFTFFANIAHLIGQKHIGIISCLPIDKEKAFYYQLDYRVDFDDLKKLIAMYENNLL